MKTAKQRLGDSGYLKQIIAGLDEGVLLFERCGQIMWANDAALAMHGCTGLDGLGADLDAYCRRFALCDEQGRELAGPDSPVDRITSGEPFADAIVRIARRESGTFDRVLSASGLVLTDSTGQLTSTAFMLKNVTAARAARAYFERNIATNPAPALVLRLRDSRFVRANQEFLDMTGYVQDDILGRPLRELDVLRDAEQREVAIEALAQHATIHPQESTLPIPGDGSKAVSLAGQPVDMGNEPCMLFTFNDLDDQKRTEIKLQRSEAGLAEAFRLAPVPMLLCTRRDWHVIEGNDAFMQATGRTSEQMAGQPLKAAGLELDARDMKQLASAMQTGDRIQHQQVQWRTESGQPLAGLLSAGEVTMHGTACILIGVRDVTERKRSEGDMVAAIEALMQDPSWFSQPLLEKLAQVRQPHDLDTGLATLTPRETEVLEQICRGSTNKQIAASLQLSRNTVRNHVANLYSKIDVGNRSSAVVWGRERGLGGY